MMRKLYLVMLSFFILTLAMNAQSLEIPILERNDDAEEKGDGSMDPGSSDLEMIYENTDFHNGTGLRFQDVNLPQGATITKAYIQFTVDEDGSEGDVTLYIKGENADDSEQFTDENFSVSSRDWSTDSVAWTPAAWAGNVGARGVDQQTSDISSLVQSVIDRPGWVSGNPVTLNIVGPKDIVVNRIAVSSGDGNSPDGPALHIEYTTLVGYWSFDEGTGDTVADGSGNGFHGQLFEGSENALDPYEWVDGIKGKAVHLTRDYMKIPADEAFALNSFSITAWIKLTAELTEWGAIYTYATGQDDYIQFGFNKSTRQMYFFSKPVEENGRGLEFGASTPLELDEWYFIALTVDDGGMVSMYLDGMLDGQSSGLKAISDTELVEPGAFGAGMNSGWEGNVMEGMVIDEASIFSSALSAGQIMSMALEHSSDLVARWKFDETSDTIAYDASGNDLDLHLTGTADSSWVDGGIMFNGINQFGALDIATTSANLALPEFTMATYIKVAPGTIVDENGRIAGVDDAWGLNLKGTGDETTHFWSHNASEGWAGGQVIDDSYSDGMWHHIAVSHNDTVGRIVYVDGIMVSDQTIKPLIEYELSSRFAISVSASTADDADNRWYLEAGYKDFRVYSRDLTAEEIRVLAGITDPLPAPGLELAYDFEEFIPEAGETVLDISGKLNDGIVNGLYINKIEGVYGSAIEFNPDALDLDASSDPNNHCVILPENQIFASQEFTISAWINASNDTLVFDPEWGEWGAIFAHDIGGAADYGLFYDPSGATMGVWSEGMGDTYLGGGTIVVGEWIHVALTVNPADSMMTLYVDGVDVANTKLSVLLPAEAVADTSCIGGSIERSKPFFGAIDEFGFYTIALSAEEIAAMAVRYYSLTTEVSISGDLDLGEILADPESEDGSYAEESDVVLTATAIDGYAFIGWEGDATGTDNPLTVTMNSNLHIKAVFEEIKYALTVNIVGEGTVNPGSGEYAGTLMLTATAADGYEFDRWSGDVGIIDSTSTMIFISMDQERVITATFVEVTGIELFESDFDLGNFPNPFSDRTIIRYNMNRQSKISLTVYDVFGKEIRVLVNQDHQPGDYSIEMDAGDLPDGVYLYRLQSESHSVTRRMIISK